MIQIIFYSLLLFKVLKLNFFLHKILWVHYSRTTKKKINFTTKGRAERFLLLSLSPSLCALEHPSFGLVLGASQPRGGQVVGEASLHHCPELCLQHEVSGPSPAPH